VAAWGKAVDDCGLRIAGFAECMRGGWSRSSFIPHPSSFMLDLSRVARRCILTGVKDLLKGAMNHA
jgi:hypothetical protein